MSGSHLLKNVIPLSFCGYADPKAVDIAVADGKVQAVGQNLAAPDGAVIRDFQGAFVSPAWMDMHTHVYWGGADIACWPHEIGAATGVPILVDAGSAGEGNFKGFREFIIKPARERILPFLNVGSIGLVATNRVPEVRVMADIDIDRVMKTVAENADLIVGLKVRLCSYIHKDTDLLPLKLAKKLARVLRLPLMVHIGLPLPTPEEIMDRMDAGDILTHCFHGKQAGSIVADEYVCKAAVAAKARGVVFDIGHGSGSFSYRVGRECLEKGILPDTLGSDLYAQNMNGPVWDLSMVMSKMLAIGLSLEDTLAGVTAAPRRVLGLAGARLEPGAEAAFTIFRIEDADLAMPDSYGEVMNLRRRVRPLAVFWKGALADAGSRLRDTGVAAAK